MSGISEASALIPSTVPNGSVRESEIESARRLLSGWGLTSPTCATVRTPLTIEQLQFAARSAGKRGMIARGLGRSYGDPAQNAGGDVIDVTRLHSVHDIDLDAGTITVDPGISLDALLRIIVPLRHFVPVTPGTRFVTVGGAIACDIHGKNHHRDGSFAQHVVSMNLLTPSGDELTLNQFDHTENFWATAGGMGLTGIITRATIRLIRIETDRVTVDIERAANLDDAMAKMVERDSEYRYSVAWVDTLARGSSLGRSILYRGNHTRRNELSPDARTNQPAFAPRSTLNVPDFFPGGLIRPATARVFNALWFRKHKVFEYGRQQSLRSFFHQLDGVGRVNRLYGGSGFIQYQFVVPVGGDDVVRRVIERLANQKVPSFLVVLKRMGPNPGLISFPMCGWTLAVDIPTRFPGLGELLDEFDDMVAEARGRIYLAKDSRMKPELLPEMYPNLERWRFNADRLDPERRMQSDLARRLCLRG